MPRGARRLPPSCEAVLRRADLIIHAGDFCSLAVLTELRLPLGPVVGVHGNVDEPAVRAALPETARVETGAWRIGVIHDGGAGAGTLQRCAAGFPQTRGPRFRRRAPPSGSASPRPAASGCSAEPHPSVGRAAHRIGRRWRRFDRRGGGRRRIGVVRRSRGAPAFQRPWRHGLVCLDWFWFAFHPRGLPRVLSCASGVRSILFDCGEGTQRQLVSSVGLTELTEIFLTHFHADHWLGLPGMLKTFDLRGRERPLAIHGPPGLRALLSLVLRMAGRVGFVARGDRARAGRRAGA